MNKSYYKKEKNSGITLIALVITIIVLLILAGITIAMLTGSESAPAKANEAKQQNDIGSAKDQLAILVQNEQLEAYDDVYVDNNGTVKAAAATTTIGQRVINAALRQYGAAKQIGDATMQVTQSVEGEDAIVTITTRDFTEKGYIEAEGGKLNWGLLVLAVNTNGYTSGEWTKENIKITLTSDVNGAKFQSSLDDGTNWQNCNSEINITEDTNVTYKFRVLDSADKVVKTSARYIIKRDATGPAITATAVANNDWASISSIQVNVTSVSDAGIGVDSPMTIYYYCKLYNQSEYELKYQGNDTSYKIDDLEPFNTYSVKVVVRDKLGNEGVFQKNEETYSCFVAGTKVKTENGMKNIEDIKVGEKVYTVNLDTNATELKEVTKTLVNKADVTYLLHIGNETIEATPKHEFYIVDKGWVRAYALQEGDYIYGEPSKKIEKIEKKEHYEPINVYNLVIDGNHNYLITNYGVLVHNGSPM